VTLRPVRPEDEAQHLAFLEGMSAEDIRMRIFYSRRNIERSELARLVQIDYEREMAFVAVATRADGGEETLGVVRSLVDPDNVDAEFGILVRSDLKGSGLGSRLMDKLVAYQRSRGTQRLSASVLAENQRMRAFCARLGFVEQPESTDADPGTVRIELPLGPR
jgi:acetyltransferase